MKKTSLVKNLLLSLLSEFFLLNLAYFGKIIKRLDPEASQELFRCAKKYRSSGRIHSSEFLDKIKFNKLVDGM